MNDATPLLAIVDLEATCWPTSPHPANEIIEIGAVMFATDDAAVPATPAEFQAFVRPTLHPQLSAFCTDLTGITQAEVDAAETFPAVFARFAAWLDQHPGAIVSSWGRYDHNQLVHDCKLHGIDYPQTRHINLKQSYSRLHNLRPHGMKRALAHAGLPLDGTHHRGIDDARNITKLVASLLHTFSAADVIDAGSWLG
ncbi:MAG: exonuclease domain-containing protein [Planctomycetota bacterium]